MLKNKILAGTMALIMPLTMCLTGCSFVSMFNTFSYQSVLQIKPAICMPCKILKGK